MESKKNDRQDNKLRWDLLPLETIEEIVKVYHEGAKKYGENTWQNLDDGYNRYKGAMMRHLVAHEKGEIFDKETGCRHLAQVAWNAIAMLHCSLVEYENGLKTINGIILESINKKLEERALELKARENKKPPYKADGLHSMITNKNK